MDSTPQNFALRWLTDEDSRQVSVGDSTALLERYALATFYFSTYVYSAVLDFRQSDNEVGAWSFVDFWMSEEDVCVWYGVSCLSEGVQELKLTDNNVRGRLPSELAALEKLQSLDLGNNKLSGTVPKSFGTFQALSKYLYERTCCSGQLVVIVL